LLVHAPRPDPATIPEHRTWAEISLLALRDNFRAIQKHVGAGVAICAVVKADAYGHGVVECARALESAGAPWLGVTDAAEGLALRSAGLTARILLMTGMWRGEEHLIVSHHLTPTIWEPWHIQLLENAARQQHAILPVHLKLDTGMNRLGASKEAWPNLFDTLANCQHLRLEGVSTHFATVLNPQKTSRQVTLFEEGLAILRRKSFQPTLLHMANSAAVSGRPDTWKTMVRPGIALYGYSRPEHSQPVSDEEQPTDIVPAVQPVLAWKTRVIALKDAAAGQAIGYGGTFVANQPCRIAVLPVGYADGFHRLLSNRGRVLVRGQYAPVAGRVSMDLTTSEISHIPGVEVGDEVVLIGESHGKSIDAREHARLCGTIPYEILCNISERVPRMYLSS
jgi:alanine racemase